MIDDLPFPDPRKFGTSPEELGRLGEVFLRYLRLSWADLPPTERLNLEAKLRRKPVSSGINVYFDAAIKHALAGKLRLAGKHYRSWLNIGYVQHKGLDVSRAVRRQVSASRASRSKTVTAHQKRLKVISAARGIVKKRQRPISANELAKQVGSKVGIPSETARRLLKGLPEFKRRH